MQLGFIAGTLAFALTAFADRYPASRVFAGCAIVGALANAGFAWHADSFGAALLWRFTTGFALAGVYPVGGQLGPQVVWLLAPGPLLGLIGMLGLLRTR